MNTLLPGLRVAERHVNQSSETTKFRNHYEKEQNQRFALQELLKQFLAISRYITAIFYQPKTKMRQGNYYSSQMAEIALWWLQNAI